MIEKLTKQSRIYVPNKKNGGGPHKIKYFGDSTSSGLYSYVKSGKIDKDDNWQQGGIHYKNEIFGEVVELDEEK